MKTIPLAVELLPWTLERLDTAVRLAHRRQEPFLDKMDRNQLLEVAIELGLRYIEQLVGIDASQNLPSSQSPTVPPTAVGGVRTLGFAQDAIRTKQTARSYRIPASETR